MTPPTQPLGTPSSKTYTDHWRKTLLYEKWIEFFLGSAGPGWLVVEILAKNKAVYIRVLDWSTLMF